MKRLAVSLFLCLLVFAGCSDPATEPAPSASGEPLPYPDLGTIDPQVRMDLERQRASFESAIAAETDPGRRARAHGELGMLYHAHRLLDPAVAAYERAGAGDPADFRWPYFAALIADERGEGDSAVGSLEMALAIRPDYSPAQLRLGDLLLRANRLDEAETEFRAVLERHPVEGYALYGLGQIALERDDPEAALVHFEKVLVAQPGADSVHHALARTYRGLERLDRARHHAELAGAQPVELSDPLFAELLMRGNSALAHILRGNRAFVLRRYDLAAAAYREAVTADPEHVEARLSLGSALFLGGDVNGGRAVFEEAAALAPDSTAARIALGQVLAASGAHEKAIAEFRRALEADPGNGDTLLAIARSQHESGRHTEAVATYRQALDIAPDDLRIKLELPVALAASGKDGEAATMLRALVTEQPQSAEARLLWGTILASTGDIAAATEQLEAATQLQADGDVLGEAHLNLGMLRGAVGDVDGAAASYRAALEHDPSLSVARLNLANYLTRSGGYDEALVHYAELVRGNPREPSVRLGQSLALLLSGKPRPAAEALEAGLAGDPRNPSLSNALARLLATSSDAGLRDAPRSLSLARAAMAAGTTPAHTETLAMALAANGELSEAAELMDRLSAYAERRGNIRLAGKLSGIAADYRAGRLHNDPFGSQTR